MDSIECQVLEVLISWLIHVSLRCPKSDTEKTNRLHVVARTINQRVDDLIETLHSFDGHGGYDGVHRWNVLRIYITETAKGLRRDATICKIVNCAGQGSRISMMLFSSVSISPYFVTRDSYFFLASSGIVFFDFFLRSASDFRPWFFKASGTLRLTFFQLVGHCGVVQFLMVLMLTTWLTSWLTRSPQGLLSNGGC